VISEPQRRDASSPLETDHVSHGSHGEIRDQVHISTVHLVDQVDPFLHGTEMRIEQGEINDRVTCIIESKKVSRDSIDLMRGTA